MIKPAYLFALGSSLLFGIGSNAADPKHAGNGAPPPSLATAKSVSNGVETKIEDLRRFNHLATIAASSNPQTIKFERVKLTKVFTEVKFTSDQGHCKELQFRDPGGSMYCPSTRLVSPAPAYEVTYSYTGQPLASDEYGNRYFQFQVYFRPGELPPAVRSAISAGKTNRPKLASYFKLTTARLPARFTVIDPANSSLCAGDYAVAAAHWIRHDRNCRDHISFKTVTRPSDYITVRVEPVSI